MTNDTPASAQPQTVAEAIKAAYEYAGYAWEREPADAYKRELRTRMKQIAEAARREARTEAAVDTEPSFEYAEVRELRERNYERINRPAQTGTARRMRGRGGNGEPWDHREGPICAKYGCQPITEG